METIQLGDATNVVTSSCVSKGYYLNYSILSLLFAPSHSFSLPLRERRSGWWCECKMPF